MSVSIGQHWINNWTREILIVTEVREGATLSTGIVSTHNTSTGKPEHWSHGFFLEAHKEVGSYTPDGVDDLPEA